MSSGRVYEIRLSPEQRAAVRRALITQREHTRFAAGAVQAAELPAVLTRARVERARAAERLVAAGSSPSVRLEDLLFRAPEVAHDAERATGAPTGAQHDLWSNPRIRGEVEAILSTLGPVTTLPAKVAAKVEAVKSADAYHLAAAIGFLRAEVAAELDRQRAEDELADWSALVQTIAANPVAASLDRRVDAFADRLAALAQSPISEHQRSKLRSEAEEIERRYTTLVENSVRLTAVARAWEKQDATVVASRDGQRLEVDPNSTSVMMVITVVAGETRTEMHRINAVDERGGSQLRTPSTAEQARVCHEAEKAEEALAAAGQVSPHETRVSHGRSNELPIVEQIAQPVPARRMIERTMSIDGGPA